MFKSKVFKMSLTAVIVMAVCVIVSAAVYKIRACD